MSLKLNGSRLREARQFRRLTITKLAEKVGISKQMISKYERGNASPGLNVFQKIVQILGFPLNFFTTQDKIRFCDEGTFFRSRLTATQAEKNPTETFKRCIGITRDLFQKYVEFPDLFDRRTTARSPANAAAEVRNLWGLGEQPINNMVRLLETHGIVVSVLSSNASRVDANSGFIKLGDNEYYVILINSGGHSFYRQQFSLAHELGHFILHARSFDPQSLEATEYRKMEKEADEFASAFLLPRVAFIHSLQDRKMNLDWYLQLKSIWSVSAASMVYRARNLEVLSADEYLKLQKRISYHQWRKGEPLDNISQIAKPELLSQSLDLVEHAGIFKANQLSGILDEIYGIPYPNELLAEIIGVPVTRFNGQVVHLKSLNQ